MIALISTEELEGLGQLMIKQLKNRYSDISQNKRFMVGVDRSRMKLFDLEDPQANLQDSGAQQAAPQYTSTQKQTGNYDDIKF